MVTSLVTGVVDGLRADARTPGSRLEERLVDAVTDAAARAATIPSSRHASRTRSRRLVDRAMARFGNDVDALVTGTISRWDAERTADQLELLLGPDLQYIRINRSRWLAGLQPLAQRS